MLEIRDWVALASACIVALGWFVTGYVSKKKDIAIKRFEHRVEALKPSILLLSEIKSNDGNPFAQRDFNQRFNEFQVNMILYGEEDERNLTNELVMHLKAKNSAVFQKSVSDMLNLLRERLRKELGMSI